MQYSLLLSGFPPLKINREIISFSFFCFLSVYAFHRITMYFKFQRILSLECWLYALCISNTVGEDFDGVVDSMFASDYIAFHSL